MSYEKRLRHMVEQGSITTADAAEFEKSLAQLPPALGDATPSPLPLVGMMLVCGGLVVLALVALVVSASSGNAGTQDIQNVAQALNAANATGDIGSTATSLMALGLLVLVPILGVMLFLAAEYNGIIDLYETERKTRAYIDHALQRREKLVPQLQDIIQQAMHFEESTQSTIAEQRTHSSAQELKSALDSLSENTALAPMLSATVESYPQLKSHTNMLALQDTLDHVERDLMIARNVNTYAAANLNVKAHSILGSLAASMAGVRPRHTA